MQSDHVAVSASVTSTFSLEDALKNAESVGEFEPRVALWQPWVIDVL